MSLYESESYRPVKLYTMVLYVFQDSIVFVPLRNVQKIINVKTDKVNNCSEMLVLQMQ